MTSDIRSTTSELNHTDGLVGGPIRPAGPASRRASRVMNGSLIFVATRCTLQYVVLPFVLPWFGIGGRFSVVISAVLEVVALGMIAFNLRQLWNTDWRWRYMGLSVLTVSLIIIFLYFDLRNLSLF
ncbi:MAG TPA: hypothetical protein PKE45_10030 [Caldilineaceae bacterium]|nr:hypothetical protein [Caldilineaceae bacterium]